MVDGVRVESVLARPGGIAVTGTWSGGVWQPMTSQTLQHYRNHQLLGIWRIDGVDVILGPGRNPIIFLSPIEDHDTIKPGDVLILGEGVYTIIPVRRTDVPAGAAVEIGASRIHAVTEGKDNRTTQLLVFHSVDAAIERTSELRGWWRNKRVRFSIDSTRLAPGSDYAIEIFLNGKAVQLSRVLQTLLPLRGFILDAGQELLYRTQRGYGSRRLKGTYTYFDPLFSAQPGSLRVFIHPAMPEQIPLFVEPAEPLRLLVNALRAASERDIEGVLFPLTETIFSVEALLKKLAAIADTAKKFGPFMIRTPDIPEGFKVEQHAGNVIRNGIKALETRVVEREAILYGMDLYRNWLRLMSERDDGVEDWTLRYNPELREKVEGKAPRKVFVVFETKARPDVSRGTGWVIDISTIREPGEATKR